MSEDAMGYETHTGGQGAASAPVAVSEDVRAVLESLEEFAALPDTPLWGAGGERHAGVVVEQEELQWWARVFRRVARATATPDAAGDAATLLRSFGFAESWLSGGREFRCRACYRGSVQRESIDHRDGCELAPVLARAAAGRGEGADGG